ncbi:MAG: hypothetical protein AAFR47_17635 [Pseudomonadota bacterium]
MVDDLSAIIGLVGVGVYLGSYWALNAGILRGDSAWYATLNIVAASCVLIDLQSNFNLPAALIQVSWIAISCYGLSRICARAHSLLPQKAEAPDPRMMRSHSYMDSLHEAATGRTVISKRWTG